MRALAGVVMPQSAASAPVSAPRPMLPPLSRPGGGSCYGKAPASAWLRSDGARERHGASRAPKRRCCGPSVPGAGTAPVASKPAPAASIGRRREGASATLCSEGIHRDTIRVPVANDIAATSRRAPLSKGCRCDPCQWTRSESCCHPRATSAGRSRRCFGAGAGRPTTDRGLRIA